MMTILTRPTMAVVGAFVVGAIAAAVPAAPATTDGRGAAGLNPQAPAETAQFSFLIGEWECTTRFLLPDGSGYKEGRARWTGTWILDGWAIQDFWVGFEAGQPAFHGTNIRSFNPRTGKWDNRWLAAGSLEWKYFEAERQGSTMVMTGGEGTDPRGAFVDRNTFYEIGADGWRWRKDRSYDGGETWIEGIGFIEAKRAGPAAPAAAAE